MENSIRGLGILSTHIQLHMKTFVKYLLLHYELLSTPNVTGFLFMQCRHYDVRCRYFSQQYV